MSSPSTLSTRLRQARLRANHTLEEIAALTGLGVSSVSEFESGKRDPSVAQLSKLAGAYRQSMAFFLDEAPASAAAPAVLWRERPTDAVAEELGGRFRTLAEQYRLLETWCEEPEDACLPTYVPAHRDTSFDRMAAESLAHKVRAELRLGDYPADGLRRLLEENCGVKVFHVEFGFSGPAACLRSPDLGAAVFLNRNTNGPRRWNFDLAHELFHLVTWDYFSDKRPDPMRATEQEERCANAFAAGLLMPDEAFRDALARRERNGQWEYADLLAVTREFGVSAEAMLWRIKNLKLAEIADVPGLAQRLRESAQRMEPPETREIPPFRPARFEALARRALEQGEMSTGKFAEFMGISRHEALKTAADIARRQEEAHGGETLQASPA